MQTILTIIVLACAFIGGFAAGRVAEMEHQRPELKAQRWTNIKAAIRGLFRKNNT
jgi:hypothetical protein